MTKNPYVNALVAWLYIIVVVLLLTFGPVFAREKPDTIFAPMAVLSLLVLSVAFMGSVFFMQPILMYLEGHKREAVEFFVKTLTTFAGITAVVLFFAFIL